MPALVQVMAWHQAGKPLSGAMLAKFHDANMASLGLNELNLLTNGICN